MAPMARLLIGLRLLTLSVGVALGGCATVVERYQLGSPDRLPAASLEAATRLGWTTESLGGGGFRLVDRLHSGLLRKDWVSVTPGADGVLTLSGPVAERDWEMHESLGAVGPLLAQATLQRLGTAAEGPPVEPRSVALTVGLDLLLPAVGAAYALPGSPYLTSNWTSHWAWWVGAHGLLDALAAVHLGLGVDYYQRGERGMGLGYVGGAIAGLVLNRLVALLFQLPVVQMGNAASESGLWLDASRAPARLPDPG